MKKQTGMTYQPSQYAKQLLVSDAKIGKTTYLVGAALGCLPWQREGGIIDKPEHLAVFSLDASAVDGIAEFLVKTCGAPQEALQFTVYNLEDDLRAVSTGKSEYDNTFYNALMAALKDFAQNAGKGTLCAIASSLTGFAEGIKRGIAGPCNGEKKSTMDQNKWDLLGSQLAEVRNLFQTDKWHCLWEGHTVKEIVDDVEKDKISGLQGSVGKNFPYNVEHVFKICRNFGTKFEKTKCDQVYLDTQPSLAFIAGGRKVNERLQGKEPDLANILRKLGKVTSGWNQR